MVLMWPMYTGLNLFMGCFLMNGIVQFVLVVRPSLIPDSWNDKHVAWGVTSFVWIGFILASAIMHYNDILPPSYFSLRGINHDLSKQATIVFRRIFITISFTAICILRIMISVNPQRSFYSTISRKLACFKTGNCNTNAEDDIGLEDNISHHSTPDIGKNQDQPSNQVLSNGTLFLWSITWFVGMSLRWIYGDEDLVIADISCIAIFYFYPLVIVTTNCNIRQFVKRRIVVLYHRCIQDIFWYMLVAKYCFTLRYCREPNHDDKKLIIAENNEDNAEINENNAENDEVSGQWAIKTIHKGTDSIEFKAEFCIENESCHSKFSQERENCVLESLE